MKGDKFMDHRVEVPQAIREQVITDFVHQLRRRLEKHGEMSYIGPHECLGSIAEEYKELTDAVQMNNHGEVMAEAFDLMIASFWTVASLRAIQESMRLR